MNFFGFAAHEAVVEHDASAHARRKSSASSFFFCGSALLARLHDAHALSISSACIRVQASDVQTLLDKGRALHARGRLGDAFAQYQSAYAIAPEEPEVLHLLGVAYFGMGQSAFGLAFIRKAVARKPDEAIYRANLAQALMQEGLLTEAAVQLEAACALKPDDAESLARLASLQVQLERPADAERAYAAALAIEPQRAEWHEAMARLQYQRWALPEAINSAQRALQASSADGPLNIGYALPRQAQSRPSPALLLKASPSLTTADLLRHCAERELLVFDDFLDDPMGFRAEALRLIEKQARHPAQANFPGIQTPPLPCGEALQRVADALGRPVKWDSLDSGALRLSQADDDARADVHLDSDTVPHIFGAVLYLSLPADCRGGTAFYRHRATGFDHRPGDMVLRGEGFANFLAFQKRHLPPNRLMPFTRWQAARDATWEWLFEVPMKFNRLIVYRSDYFHGITELFGDRLDNGRLVQLFHFESKP